MRLICLIIAGVGGTLFPSLAVAQIYTPPFNINHRMYEGAYEQQNDARNENEDQSSPSIPSVAPPAAPATLTFRVSPTVRKQTIATMLANQRKVDPVGASKTEALFASADIIGQIDQAMRQRGLRANNVADAYAVWWVSAWEAVNNRDMGASPELYQAVKRQAEQVLLATPQLTSAGSAVKQELAESLLIHAALIDASVEMAAENRVERSALAKSVNQGAKTLGMDMTKLDLTPDGFVPRAGGRSDAGDVSGDGAQLAASEEGGSNLALYAVAGTGLLAGVFALGKGLAKKG